MTPEQAEAKAREIDSRLAYHPASSDRVDTITTALLAAYEEGKKEGERETITHFGGLNHPDVSPVNAALEAKSEGVRE